MSDDREIVELLRDAEAPIEPRPEYRRHLREELFRGGAVDVGATRADPDADRAGPDAGPDAPVPDHEARSSPSRRWVVAVAAAAALIVTGVVALVAVGSDRYEVSTPPPTMVIRPDVDAMAVRAACDRYRTTAFDPLTRSQVTGARNGDALRTVEEALTAARRLGEALDRLVGELDAAGVSPSATSQLREASGRLDVVVDPATFDGRASSVRARLAQMEDYLIYADRDLIEAGVPQCL